MAQDLTSKSTEEKLIPLEKEDSLEKKIIQLQSELDSLRVENQQFKSSFSKRNNLTWWTSKVISTVGLIYLIAVIFAPSNVKINKIGNTEIFIFAIVLLFNAGILEKLEDFSVDGTKIQAKFQKLEAKQEQQNDEIVKLQQQQLDLQKKQLEALTVQQSEIRKLQEEQNSALGFIARHLIESWQVELLEKLKEAAENKKRCNFEYTSVRGIRLRNLRAIGLVMNYPGKSIAEIERLKSADLTDYFYVTKSGLDYLNLRNSLGVQNNSDSEE